MKTILLFLSLLLIFSLQITQSCNRSAWFGIRYSHSLDLIIQYDVFDVFLKLMLDNLFSHLVYRALYNETISFQINAKQPHKKYKTIESTQIGATGHYYVPQFAQF